MSRLNKNTPSKAGERIDFKFTHFKALQVPKGWDKLFLSIVSVETGKTLTKTSKAIVRNGSCQWTDTLTESICISRDHFSNKLRDCLLKVVVAMGSTRYGVLGETSVDMASYTSACTSVLLPLKKCNHGTTLQVKIHCLTPRNILSDKSKERNSCSDYSVERNDLAVKSEESGGTLASSIVSLPDKGLVALSNSKELECKENFSASSLHYGYESNSTVDSIGRESFSPRDIMNNGERSYVGRQDSTSSLDSVPSGNYSTESPSGLNNSYTLPTMGSASCLIINSQESPSSMLRVAGSENLLGVSADALDEIQIGAKMWEKKARKLILDLDELRKECSDQSKKLENVDKELSAAYRERDRLKKEVEELKLLLEESAANQKSTGYSVIEAEGERCINKDFEKEIKFQKELNANMELQLQRSQLSNTELVSVIQELEETIEKQKLEIEDSTVLQSKVRDMENSIRTHKEENANLLLQLQQLKESEHVLRVQVKLLEEDIEQKNLCKNNGEDLNGHIFLDDPIYDPVRGHLTGLEAMNKSDANLLKENQHLKEKILELERDCNELTDENLDLLLRLKESKCGASAAGTFEFLCNEPASTHFTSSDSEVSVDKVYNLEQKVRKDIVEDLEDNYHITVRPLENSKMELQVKIDELVTHLVEKGFKIDRLKSKLVSKDEQIGHHKACQSKPQAMVSNLLRENNLKEVEADTLVREIKCLANMQSDQYQILEDRLAEALEANNVYKLQLQRLSKDQVSHMCEGKMVPKERYDSLKSSLEAELDDVRDRYLHMSLKCAEVEARREELVMKLKAVKKEKRWFI